MSQSYQPLHHKYRPQSLDALIGQEAIATTLKQALLTNRIAPAYLFSGPRGTGKTSSARILARSLNCLHSEQPTPDPCGNCEVCKTIANSTSLDVIEIDAASNTGVDNIRELIERSRFAPVQARWKVYVIDECHMLSTAAFNALLKTLEEPSPNVVFILATTDPQRVLPTILSRCQRFDFRRISIPAINKHLREIANQENILIEEEVLQLISQKAQGGLRDAESMLDQLFLLPQPIKVSAVLDLLGAIPEEELIKLIEALTQEDPVKLLETCRQLIDLGNDSLNILQGLASMLRDLVLFKSAPDRPELAHTSQRLHDQLREIVNSISSESLLRWQAQLKGTESQLRNSVQPTLWLEVLLLGMLYKSNNINQEKPTNPKVYSGIKQHKTTNEIAVKSALETTENSENQSPCNDAIPNSSNDNIKAKNAIAEINLNDIWHQILGRLELPSTRMLLSQQAKLTGLTQEKAIVQVTANWMGMVQSRSNILQEAINKALDSSRQLILEANAEPNVLVSNNNNVPKSNKISTKKESPLKEPENILNKENKDTNSPLKNQSKIENNIDGKAKQLADFFNGEVLDIEI